MLNFCSWTAVGLNRMARMDRRSFLSLSFGTKVVDEVDLVDEVDAMDGMDAEGLEDVEELPGINLR